MMPSYFLYFVCLFSRYVSFVTSIPHVDPCVQWVRNKYGDRYVYRDGSYFFNGTDKIRSRMVHPCLLAMYLENLNGYTVATQTPDHNPLTNQWPPATIPRRDYGNSMILSGYEEPAYHLGLLPMDIAQLNTTFLFVDGNFDRCTLIQPSEHAPRFIRRGEYEKIYVLAHDFNQDPSTDANDAMQFLASWLLRYDVPADVVQPKILAVLVDWTAGARAGLNNTFYRQAAVNTIVVGRQVGMMIEQLADAGSVNLDNMHLIGEGLGAQVLHFAARWFTTGQASDANMVYRVGRLTALDPMAAHFEGFRPLFGEWPHVSRLDAIRVDVITTSGGKNLGLGPDALNGQVGMGQSVGFKQFYVNGGQEQPSCLDTWPGTEHIYYDFCSHEKALMYFLYSLRPEVDRVLLMARPAPDYRSFLQAIQDDVAIDINMHAYLGMEAFNGGYNLDGDFYISINLNHNLEASHLEAAMTPEKEPRKFNYRFLSVPMAPYTPDTPDVYLQHGVQSANLSTLDAKSCGKFRQDPKHSQDGRVFRGQRPYAGQFPWAVCMVTYREDEQRWWNECTGAILDKHWILIAAHCFLFDEHSPFYITYGTNECLNLPGNSTFRKVVFERNTTVLVHPKYIQGQESYDVALIRLSDPIEDLPSYDEEYTGGLVNSVCFHTNQNYNKSEGGKVYVAGFGSKGLGRNDDSNLTWTYGRVVEGGMDPIYQSLFLGEFYRQQRTDVLDYYKFEKWHTTCGGDSGSSYLWYIDTGDQEVTNVSKYRAVTVSIVNAAIESCEFRYFHDVTTLGVGADMAVKVYHPEIYAWINQTMSMRGGDTIFPAPEQDPGTNNWPRPGFHI